MNGLTTIHELARSGVDVTGFEVEALDGKIGTVDEATWEEAAGGYMIVDTGPWVLGRRLMVPAALVQSVDVDGEKVFVARTKDELKDAPEYRDELRADEEYAALLGRYYGL
jgi:hypothetical protein